MAEKTSGGGEHAEYGAILHNIASCLHCIGDFDAARAYYEHALAVFDARAGPTRFMPGPSRIWTVVYGDIDQKRRDFVRERLVDVEFRRKPDLDQYLDQYGARRRVTPDLTQPPLAPPQVQLAPAAATGLFFGAPALGANYYTQ